MNVIFKKAGAGDIPLLLELMNEFYIIEHLPFDEEILTSGLKKLFSSEHYGFLTLIYEENSPAGYILVTYGFSLEFYGVDALVDEFYIRENYRGKGIGKQTLKYVEELLLKEDVKALHLEVDRQNIAAQEVYRKSGFVDHDRYLLTKWIK